MKINKLWIFRESTFLENITYWFEWQRKLVQVHWVFFLFIVWLLFLWFYHFLCKKKVKTADAIKHKIQNEPHLSLFFTSFCQKIGILMVPKFSIFSLLSYCNNAIFTVNRVLQPIFISLFYDTFHYILVSITMIDLFFSSFFCYLDLMWNDFWF